MRVGGRRLLAVLAGGVVLAGGGVTTLAAWQDQTHDRAPLTLSRFNVQQTVDPLMPESSFVEAETSGDAGVLRLQVGNAVGLLSPGTSVTGWVGLRVDAGSTAGWVKLTGAAVDTGALASQLTYQAVAGVDETTCRTGTMPAAGGTVTVLAADATPLTTGSGSTEFKLAAGTSTAPGAVVGVCLKITLKSDAGRALSGSSISPVWTFNARSEV